MTFDHNQDFYNEKTGRFNHLELDYEKTLKDVRNPKTVMAFDAADSVRQLDPNIGVALPYLTVFNPNIIPMLFTEDQSVGLLSDEVTGQFETTLQNFTFKEFSGRYQPYNDMTTAPTANVNYNTETREQFRFESSIIYGNLEVGTHSLAQINLIADLQESVALTMAKGHEKINLYGVNEMKLYGFLNCPDYESDVQALNVSLNDGSKSTKWDDKAQDKRSGANHIAADVIHLFKTITKRTKGIVSNTSDFILVVAPEDYSNLTSINEMGISCMTILKGTLPNIEVRTLPQLSTDNGEGRKIILYPRRVGAMAVGTFGYTEKFTMGELIKQPKSFLQTCRAGTWGAIMKQPKAVGIMVVS